MCWLLTLLKEGKYKTESKMGLLLPCSSSRAFSKHAIHPFLQPGSFFTQLRIQPSPSHLSLEVISPERPSRITPPTVTAPAFSHLNPLPAISILTTLPTAYGGPRVGPSYSKQARKVRQLEFHLELHSLRIGGS